MRPSLPRARGFSIVELMVSVAIGLMALAFATRLITSSESAKSSALGTSDSMQNGMLAMFSISGDAQQAGFGLNDPLLLGCNTLFSDTRGFAMATATRGTATITPLAPAIIQSGGTGSDTISLYAGSSPSGTGTLRLVANYNGGATMNVDSRPFGFALGDVVVVAPEDRVGDCALTQVSSAPGSDPQLLVGAGGAEFRYNDGELGRTFTGSKARIFNLGPATTLAFHTWSVDNGFLRLRSTDMAASGATQVTVADNIVAIKAQYGFDRRTAAQIAATGARSVGTWSADMIDADGNSVVGSAGDYERISALRIAVVARSKTRSVAPAGSSQCTATPSQPVVFGTAEPQGVTAVPITVDVSVANDPVNWRCYRYRVFETIVPLRNANWRP